MSMKMNVNGARRGDAPWLEFAVVVAFSGVMVVFCLLAAVLVLAIRVAAYAVPLALALVIAYHVACYAGVEFSYEPSVAKGVDR